MCKCRVTRHLQLLQNSTLLDALNGNGVDEVAHRAASLLDHSGQSRRSNHRTCKAHIPQHGIDHRLISAGRGSLVHLDQVTAIDDATIKIAQVIGGAEEHTARQVHRGAQTLLRAKREAINFIDDEIIVTGMVMHRHRQVLRLDFLLDHCTTHPTATSEEIEGGLTGLGRKHLTDALSSTPSTSVCDFNQVRQQLGKGCLASAPRTVQQDAALACKGEGQLAGHNHFQQCTFVRIRKDEIVNAIRDQSIHNVLRILLR